MKASLDAFLACEADYDEATTVLFGVPYDSTTSFRPGARFGPKAIRSESFGLESYSPYQDRDLVDYKIFDGGDLELPFGDPVPVLTQIEETIGEILDDGKLPAMLGGEHLITLGAVRAVKKRYPDLVILHFDAHADLRAEYLGSKLTHAGVMRQCYELGAEIFQFGIRSGDREEFVWGRDHVTTRMFDFDGLQKLVKKLAGRKVYISLDLDVLDPSVFPGTGTPEPGGVSFQALLDACLALRGLDVVGFDVVELAPMLDASGVSTAVAGKVVRELLLAFCK